MKNYTCMVPFYYPPLEVARAEIIFLSLSLTRGYIDAYLLLLRTMGAAECFHAFCIGLDNTPF